LHKERNEGKTRSKYWHIKGGRFNFQRMVYKSVKECTVFCTVQSKCCDSEFLLLGHVASQPHGRNYKSTVWGGGNCTVLCYEGEIISLAHFWSILSLKLFFVPNVLHINPCLFSLYQTFLSYVRFVTKCFHRDLFQLVLKFISLKMLLELGKMFSTEISLSYGQMLLLSEILLSLCQGFPFKVGKV
jgi:hypothetical protein